jgi:hypothetical protein
LTFDLNPYQVHISQYLDLTDPASKASDSAWMTLGDAIRLSYSIGLHLDGHRWKLHDELVRRRHDLFWQVFVVDTWMVSWSFNLDIHDPEPIPYRV